MVRYADPYFDEIKKANIGGLMFLNWARYNFSDSSSAEFIEEMKNYSTVVFKNKKWQKVRISDKAMMKEFDYPAPFGKLTGYSMYLEEMPLLTELYPSIDEAGFYIYGFDKFTNYFTLPLLSAGLKIFPGAVKQGGKLFAWSVKKFSKPPYICLLKLIAEGIKDGKPRKFELSISHEDGYFLTAVPVVATLMQYAEGLVKPGLHFMAYYPDPLKLVADMKFMGVNIEIKE
jgi:saccharopine dehydrogenase (NAD+, L-lysine-forming)